MLEPSFINIYKLSVELSTIYRIDAQKIFDALEMVYNDQKIPIGHIQDLKKQIEDQKKRWKIKDEEVEIALAIIKPHGFSIEEIEGKEVYTAELRYRKSRENLFLKHETLQELNKKNFAFHYSPYNFDSLPEKNFLIQMLGKLNENITDVEDIYFMGGLNSPSRTDFLFEYKDKNAMWRNYTPDFLIKKKNGEMLIIEIKKESSKDDPIDGTKGIKAMALHKIEKLNKNKIKYKMLLTNSSEIGFENINKTKKWIDGK